MTQSVLTRPITIGDWVRHEGITRVVSDIHEAVPGFDGRSLDLVGGEGHLVATVDERDVEPVPTTTVTYWACPGCGDAVDECSCHLTY